MNRSLNSLPPRLIAAEIADVGRKTPGQDDDLGPYAQGRGKRTPLSKENGRGYCDYVPITPDLLLNICNRKTDSDIAFNFISEGFVKFHYRVAGTSDILMPNGDVVRMHGPTCGVLAQPEGDPKGEICRKDEAERWMTVLCSRRFISDQIGVDTKTLPAELRQFAAKRNAPGFHAVLPLESSMIVAVNDVITNNLTGNYRSMYLEGKVLELISMTLSNLAGHQPTAGKRGATPREREQLKHAVAIVEENLANPPLLASIASQVGMNPSRLNRLFKQTAEMTYGQYVIDQRMRKAHEYLRSGELSITEIAHTLGYEYTGNFSAAFRRFFGVSPKSYQRTLGH